MAVPQRADEKENGEEEGRKGRTHVVFDHPVPPCIAYPARLRWSGCGFLR